MLPKKGLINEYIEVVIELYTSMGAELFQSGYDKYSKDKEIVETSTQGDESIDRLLETGVMDHSYLFDPGVEADAFFPDELSTLPCSSTFTSIVGYVITSFSKLHERLQSLSSDPLWNMVRAMRCRNGQIIQKLFSVVEKRRSLTGVEILLMMKAVELGLIEFNESLFNTKPAVATNSQKNAIEFEKLILSKIHKLAC